MSRCTEPSFTSYYNVVVSNLRDNYREINDRKIRTVCKWVAEMLQSFVISSNSVSECDVEPSTSQQNIAEKGPNSLCVAEQSVVWLAQCCMECQEFDRAARICEGRSDAVLRFLHYYARYLAGEKFMLDTVADSNGKIAAKNDNLLSLKSELMQLYLDKKLDSYLLYLYGVILHQLAMDAEAETVLIEAIHANPKFFGSWQELVAVIKSRDRLEEIKLPDHWLKQFFFGEAYLSLQMAEEALAIYTDLKESGFSNSPYVLTQLALTEQNLQNIDAVVDLFKSIFDTHPYRIDHADSYSNALFVKGMRLELATLAHHMFKVNKYCPETCCVVGNYYSLRGEHEQAIVYFQRALKLDPKHASAWTLMGHEFMEMKNTSGAILAYRNALEVDPKDFKAWYGLGQLYEILKMPFYAIYYYDNAHQLRPQDSRMIIALGEMFEKQSKLEEARKCYWKAHCVGDIEGLALVKLGKLAEKLKDNEQAAAVYTTYLKKLEEQNVTDPVNQPNCYLFLANHHMNHNQLDECYNYAQMCLEYEAQREEAKKILKHVSLIRAGQQNQEEIQIAEQSANAIDVQEMSGVESPAEQE